MNYAIQLLEREADIIKKCLNEGDFKVYPESKKDRDSKLKDIELALKQLTQTTLF
jgi:hypothetical protein